MTDLASIGAALSSLKTAFEISKSLVETGQATAINAQIGEIQQMLLSAQASGLEAQAVQAALTEEIKLLKEEIAALHAWGSESERYELQERMSGVFAYRIKEGSRGAEPDHWICAHCFEDKHKSILHTQRGERRTTRLVCPRCRTELSGYE